MNMTANSKLYHSILIMISGIFMLSGCAIRSNKDHYIARSTPISNACQLKGKIAGYDQNNNWRGTFTWVQSESDYTILLIPSLSQHKLKLTNNHGQAKLVIGDEVYTDSNLEDLLYSHTNWNIPLTSLKYWLQGSADPNKKSTPSNHVNIIYQDGWKIEYKSFIQESGKQQPKKIFLSKDDYNIRIIISSWKI